MFKFCVQSAVPGNSKEKPPHEKHRTRLYIQLNSLQSSVSTRRWCGLHLYPASTPSVAFPWSRDVQCLVCLSRKTASLHLVPLTTGAAGYVWRTSCACLLSPCVIPTHHPRYCPFAPVHSQGTRSVPQHFPAPVRPNASLSAVSFSWLFSQGLCPFFFFYWPLTLLPRSDRLQGEVPEWINLWLNLLSHLWRAKWRWWSWLSLFCDSISWIPGWPETMYQRWSRTPDSLAAVSRMLGLCV